MSAIAEQSVTIRSLLPHQWPLLEPVFAAQGHPLPPYSQLPVMVAMDSEGRVVGCLLAHQWSVELELWVDPAYRAQGVGSDLAAAMQPEIDEMRPFTAYARNEASEALCRAFGLVEQQGKLFVAEEL